MKQNAARLTASTMVAALALSTAAQAQTTRPMRYVPQDTVIRLKLSESINSRTARAGDLFTAQVTVEGAKSYETTLGGSTTAPLLRVDSVKQTGHLGS